MDMMEEVPTTPLIEGPSIRTFKSVADNIRSSQPTHNSDDEEDFSAKPPRAPAGTKLKEDIKEKPLRTRSQEDFRQDLFRILRDYFKSAFTIIVKKRNLCPSGGFGMARVLGVHVPIFLHPSSQEYVEEVTQKLLLFLKRNTAEGCVLHIMFEKNKTMYVVQRFVFKMFGVLDIQKLSQESDFDMDLCKQHCANSLLQLLNTDIIKPIDLHTFSRWNISIGIKKEFVQMDDDAFQQLWAMDPNKGFFPWRERQKSLASTDSVNVRIDLSGIKRDATPSQQAESSSGISEQDITDPETDSKKTPEIVPSQDEPVFTPPHPRNAKVYNFGMTPTPSDIDDNEENGTVCLPISSFLICDGLLLTVFCLQYPAPPMQKIFPDSSLHSPSSPYYRSSSYHRLSQMRRQRLVRHGINNV